MKDPRSDDPALAPVVSEKSYALMDWRLHVQGVPVSEQAGDPRRGPVDLGRGGLKLDILGAGLDILAMVADFSAYSRQLRAALEVCMSSPPITATGGRTGPGSEELIRPDGLCRHYAGPCPPSQSDLSAPSPSDFVLPHHPDRGASAFVLAFDGPPRSALAITFYRPTTTQNSPSRSATTSGCSTTSCCT